MNASQREDPPRSISLQLTEACNLRCRMCCEWGETGIHMKQDGLLSICQGCCIPYLTNPGRKSPH